MKLDFEIEDEGEENTGEALEREADLLQRFLEHIKNEKVVYLEELASAFNLKTQQCIDRIGEMLESGQLSGVMDDRGKFIYIAEEELKNVADFINRKGRISKQDLSKNSGNLINLENVR